MDDESAIRELLRGVVCSLVLYPEQVQVLSAHLSEGFVFGIYVADSDRGAVCAVDGRTVDALRQIAKAAGRRAKQRVKLRVLDTPKLL